MPLQCLLGRLSASRGWEFGSFCTKTFKFTHAPQEQRGTALTSHSRWLSSFPGGRLLRPGASHQAPGRGAHASPSGAGRDGVGTAESVLDRAWPKLSRGSLRASGKLCLCEASTLCEASFRPVGEAHLPPPACSPSTQSNPGALL